MRMARRIQGIGVQQQVAVRRALRQYDTSRPRDLLVIPARITTQGAGTRGGKGAIETVRVWQARKRNTGSPGSVAELSY